MVCSYMPGQGDREVVSRNAKLVSWFCSIRFFDGCVDFPAYHASIAYKMTDTDFKTRIMQLAAEYRERLASRMQQRVIEMQGDNDDHFLIYRLLGIGISEGHNIDYYQNKGRFLYHYAGTFLEQVTAMCFEYAFPDVKRRVRIENTIGERPKHFEIDCLCGKDAIEIKWRDATTDGDHITKEHARVLAIQRAGFRPVRIMFYYPNRQQAVSVQEALKAIYKGIGAIYVYSSDAWDYVQDRTGVPLLKILQSIADEYGNE